MSMERDALMREVDEELRRDQLQKLWEQYGTYFIGAAAALLLGVGGYRWMESRRLAAAERAGQQFEEALELVTTGKAEEAQKVLKTIASPSSAGYPMLAQMALAGQAVKAGKPDEAIASYDAAAGRATDELIRDYARLQSIALKIDTADFTDVQNRLTALTAEKSPWRYLARELLGVAALRAGKLDEARSTLASMSADPRVPAAARERAGALMNLVVAAELERTAPGKVEFEKTDTPAATPEATPPKPAAPPRTTAPPRGGAARPK